MAKRKASESRPVGLRYLPKTLPPGGLPTKKELDSAERFAERVRKGTQPLVYMKL